MTTHHALRVDAEPDAATWLKAARRSCHAAWIRVGRRYARRLHSQHVVRDPLDDVMTLAARRLVPQSRCVQRPLCVREGDLEARAFNALDAADRSILRSITRVEPRTGPRAEHAASALLRLMHERSGEHQPLVRRAAG